MPLWATIIAWLVGAAAVALIVVLIVLVTIALTKQPAPAGGLESQLLIPPNLAVVNSSATFNEQVGALGAISLGNITDAIDPHQATFSWNLPLPKSNTVGAGSKVTSLTFAYRVADVELPQAFMDCGYTTFVDGVAPVLTEIQLTNLPLTIGYHLAEVPITGPGNIFIPENAVPYVNFFFELPISGNVTIWPLFVNYEYVA